MKNSLNPLLTTITDEIIELKKKVDFLEEETMRHALYIKNLQECIETVQDHILKVIPKVIKEKK